MKKRFLIQFIILNSILFYSCSNENINKTNLSKDNDIVNSNSPISTTIKNFVEENPLPEFLNIAKYNKTSFSRCPNVQHVGFVFSPNVNGEINSIIVKLPAPKENLQVCIWNKTSNKIIRTENIDIQNANVTVLKKITPLVLEKDKLYAITILNDFYYQRSLSDGVPFPVLPITIGNIRIERTILQILNSQGSQEAVSMGFYQGDASFNFIQTN